MELALFGSVVAGNFGPDSDIDVLVVTVHVDDLVAKLEPLIPPVPPEAEDT